MTETLAGGWTLEKLRGKSPEERYTVWINAKRDGSAQALELATYIEVSGLEYAPSGGISLSDPRVLEMRDIVESPGGRQACLDATAKGLPALAGVEPMIVAKMGGRYGAFSQMTLTAGGLVGEVMHAFGYDVVGRGDMPPGSVAKTAARWGPKER